MCLETRVKTHSKTHLEDICNGTHAHVDVQRASSDTFKDTRLRRMNSTHDQHTHAHVDAQHMSDDTFGAAQHVYCDTFKDTFKNTFIRHK